MKTAENFDLPAPYRRPRRLRATPAMRALVSETRVNPRQLIYPVFVGEGLSEPQPIASMPGQFRHSEESFKAILDQAVQAGIGGVMLFGVPDDVSKDAQGSAAWDANGVLNRAISIASARVGDELVVMADTCLDEFTSHGHCGVLRDDGVVDNDATLELYAAQAVAQARAGAAVVSPSGMMDGQVAAIRAALDGEGFEDRAILAYSAKFASAFYGPFREAVSSTLQGDRKTYQQDPGNHREALLEAELDIEEGTDMVMVKPAGYYLDVLADVAALSPVPVAAYQVSGEYAMIHAAAEKGWIDLERTVSESLTSIVRAGADMVLTYFALNRNPQTS
ncbi:MAG: porphobilinogen synthase [Actinomycetaceae bacterium]|nr:porphobilinogen synthase [Actinomycetaceae bacterium]